MSFFSGRSVRHLRHVIGTKGAPLNAIPPRPSRYVFLLLRVVGPLYRRFGMGISDITIEDGTTHVESAKRIYAFRHPSPDDPQVVFSVLEALRRSHREMHPPIFLYGRDVPIWAGPVAAWLLPRIGGISVFHEQVQRDSMDTVYRAFRHAPNPIALAPEAQVTYHNYRVAPTQRGAARLSIEAATPRRGGNSPVEVVPIGLEYRYPDRRDRRLLQLIAAIDRRLLPKGSPAITDRSAIVSAVWERWDRVLALLEKRYRLPAPPTAPPTAPETKSIDAKTLNDRAATVAQAVLAAGETGFGLPADRSLDPISRVFRLRRTYWNALFPEPGTTKIENDLLDLDSIEARVSARHFQLVDVMAYLDFTYLETKGIVPGAPCPPAGSPDHARLVEYVLLLGDLIGRVMGHTIGSRPSWRGRRCIVRFGTPITVRATEDRTGRMRYVASLQREIESSLVSLSERK